MFSRVEKQLCFLILCKIGAHPQMHFHIVKTEFESILFLHNIKSSLMLLYRLLARYNYIIKYIMKEELLIRIAYVRVSSIQQNEARQLEALKNYGIEKWFVEKVSGKNTDRPKLQEMLNYVREGDSVYVEDFSRLARSTKDLLAIVELLEKKEVQLISLKENIDTHTPTGKLMLTMIAAIAEFERENILERQREGIAIAKQQGKFKGGHVKKINEDKFLDLYEQYKCRGISKVQMAKRLRVSRPTLDKLIKERKEKGIIE